MKNAKYVNSGGLYKNVNMSLKSANRLVLIGIVALIFCFAFVVGNSGFVVNFDTNGGSKIESQKVMYGKTVNLSDVPVKNGYIFTGWFLDENCTQEFNPNDDVIISDITLYSAWEKE